jgi:MFS family permease
MASSHDIAAVAAPKLTAAIGLRVFGPFALGYFLSYLFRTVNAVIGPDLVAELSIDAAGLGLLTSAYFLSFAAFQLPLGILLDRFGPARTEAALLLFAAAGAFLFAVAETTPQLVFARAFIGFGVSACLMAAFKSFVSWFPSGKLPLINGGVMAAGGLGALSATAPVEAALSVTDWRGVFTVLGVATLAVAAAVILVVPKRPAEAGGTTFRDQIRGVGEIFTSTAFWRVAPLTMASQAAFMSIQGLWAGPWLLDVGGVARDEAARLLFAMAVFQIAGYLAFGWVAERLSRYHVPPMHVSLVGMAFSLCVQGVLLFEPSRHLFALVAGIGFFGSSGIVTYAALSQSFAPHLAGRVNTSLNMLVFFFAFATQAGMGAVIALFPRTAEGMNAPSGYSAAFAAIVAIQLAGLAWYLLQPRVTRRGARTV